MLKKLENISGYNDSRIMGGAFFLFLFCGVFFFFFDGSGI
jgi:hypothetical protein